VAVTIPAPEKYSVIFAVDPEVAESLTVVALCEVGLGIFVSTFTVMLRKSVKDFCCGF